VPVGEGVLSLRGHPVLVRCLAMSPDGRVLASAGAGNTVWLWSVPDGKALRTLTGHQGWVGCLAMSPDGRVLAASASDHGTVRLWSLGPLRLSYLPLGHTSGEDIEWVQRTLQSGEASETERGWLEFLLAMMRWPRRFDIDIGVGEAPKRMEVGEFDIEIDR
jgi:WD40 repeat protein